MNILNKYGIEGGNFTVPNPELEIPVSVLENKLNGEEETVNNLQENNEKAIDAAVAIESLIFTLENMRGSKIINKDTGYLIGTIVSNTLSKIGLNDLYVSTEAFSGDVINYIDVSIETLSEALHRIKEGEIRYWKHFTDSITGLFKSYDSIANGRLNEVVKLQAELNSKDSEWRSKSHQITNAGIKNYFINEDGQVLRPLEVLPKDCAFNRYVLHEYSKAMTDLINKVADILSAGDHSSIEKFNKTVTDKLLHLPNPNEVFDAKYLKGLPFLCVTGYVAVQSKPVTTHSADKGLIELAKKASSPEIKPNIASVIYDKGKITLSPLYPTGIALVAQQTGVLNTLHAAEVAGGIFAAQKLSQVVVDGVFTATTYVTTEDVQEILNYGKKYAQNIIEVREFRYDAQKRLLSILDRWFATDLDPSVKEGVKLTFKLLNKYIDNFYSPFNSEMKRASNMSKACEYLIASALKTHGETVDDPLGSDVAKFAKSAGGALLSGLGKGINATASFINDKTSPTYDQDSRAV